ncbi:NHL domain-containing protein [Zea mays]|uniref:NHL domain-containing protein n=1 Tax=Zea mays TaxID=4577 RepID=A0A1D6HJ79_MAIZE|nr:NHL domain-containing protein [Zea mays]
MPAGVALLLAAAFFGYMLALLQRRVLGMYSNGDEQDHESPVKAKLTSIPPPYQKPLKPYVHPLLIPNDDEPVKQEEEEGLFTSIGKLVGGAKSSIAEIIGAAFSRKKRVNVHHHQLGRPTSWPAQESYAIPRDETPPPLDTRAPTPRKNYAFMSKEPEKIHHIRHGRPQLHGWTGEAAPQQQQPQQVRHQQYVQHHRQYSAGPQTYYEPSCDATKEIVFGAVQEGDTSRRPVEIKAVNHGDAAPYEQNGLRFRSSYSVRYNGNN